MPDAKLVLNQLNLVARDFEKTLAFYRRLGVDIPERKLPGTWRHAEVALPNGFKLEFDNAEIAGIYNAGWRDPAGSGRALIGFSVETDDAVDARYADLTGAGYKGKQPPYLTFWGARYAIVEDPDGNDVGIMGPVDRSRASWPPKESPGA
jgi:catechol 2,3-dioxygenase-like lactoylglutathione lyase family enzyme